MKNRFSMIMLSAFIAASMYTSPVFAQNEPSHNPGHAQAHNGDRNAGHMNHRQDHHGQHQRHEKRDHRHK